MKTILLGVLGRMGTGGCSGIEEVVMRLWPHYTASEIIAMRPNGLELRKRSLHRWAKRLGIAHTQETLARIRKKVTECRVRSARKESFAKRGEALAKLYRLERWRVASGLRQRTKLRLKETSTRCYKAKWRLERTHGYIPTTSPHLMWYDDTTRRTANEHLFKKRYGLDFQEAKD